MVVISSSLLTSIQVLGKTTCLWYYIVVINQKFDDKIFDTNVVSNLGHVVHYGLYIYDARRNEPLESLDDVVYYLKVRLYYIW